MRNNKCYTTCLTCNLSNPIVNAIIFSGLNNTKYLVLSQTLINSSTLSNLIYNSFAPIKVLYETSCMIFHLLKYSQNQNLQC